MRNELERRGAMKLLAAAPLAFAGGTAVAAEDAGLAAALTTALGGDAAARLAFLHDDALIVDHDVPFPMEKAAYADHLGFHTQSWEKVEVKLHGLETRVHGATGIVSAYFIQRGKPKDAGFRLRAGYCTAVCARDGGRWRALSLHMSPLSSQIIDASPS
jgi:ketosteroid isomerase-like protein